MELGINVSPEDYRLSCGRFDRKRFCDDLLDTYENKSRAARYLGVDRRTVTRWFDPEYPCEPYGRHVTKMCQHRRWKLRIDRWLPR